MLSAVKCAATFVVVVVVYVAAVVDAADVVDVADVVVYAAAMSEQHCVAIGSEIKEITFRLNISLKSY